MGRPDAPPLELRIEVELRQPHLGGQGLRLSETATLTTDGFLAAAAVLGRFHELVETLRAEQEKGGRRG